ncbi:DNA-dependent metalloprotease SPRTN [Athalia rosae]|uniref:DNA-dependent metalloprotease SPRTN n=1 Tax=Athalia rosae TaxID=37344 RepID=UPI002033E25B|nr:DNA-dependent metalloprotease SPRTN [Athalia rosae]
MARAGDFAMALELHQQLNNNIGVTENAILPKNHRDTNFSPKTLVDETLELIDPTPNIHTLFVQFNTRYFWNKLLPVEVKWSKRMTSCAGVCSFHPRNKQCVITLSAPLLKLRPRKDLVETLLHEMIHGYLFLTNNNRDRDGHGPEFHKHMYRINKEAGTQISVYHSFHDEVRLYQQHWWRCDGPCQKRGPFFGMVRRAMNRAPGVNDYWWQMHQSSCGGKFIKIREPEKPVKKSTKGKKLPKTPTTKLVSDWLTKPDSFKTTSVTKNEAPKQPKAGTSTKLGNSSNNIHGWGVGGPSTSNANNTGSRKAVNNPVKSKPISAIVPSTSKPSTVTKLGNTSNNVHGFGVGGPTSTGTSIPSSTTHPPKSARLYGTGVVGGSATGKSILLDKFSSSQATKPSNGINAIKPQNRENIPVFTIDLTSPLKRTKNDTSDAGNTKIPKLEMEKPSESAQCPVCNAFIIMRKLNDHLDECLLAELSDDENSNTPKLSKTSNDSQSHITEAKKSTSSNGPNHSNSNSVRSSQSTDQHRRQCLVCNALIDPKMTLNDHLEMCIGSLFHDDTTLGYEKGDYDEKTDKDDPQEKFPCPVCTVLVTKLDMEQHLDSCLSMALIKDNLVW